MRYKNYCSLIGIVGRDAEVRTTQQGVQYARFTLATSTGGYKKQDGTQVPEKTEWHSIVAWRQTAEFCGKYVKKGMKVDVEGMITYSEFTDQQGIKRQSVDIVASDIVLMTNPNAQQGQTGQAAAPRPQQAAGGYGQGQGGYQQAVGGYGGQQPMQQPFPPQVNSQGQPVYNQQGYGQQVQQQGDGMPFPAQQQAPADGLPF